MNDNNDGMQKAGKGAMALSDSLSVLRQMIASSSCISVAELVDAAVRALVSHQDIDGCEVVIIAGAMDRETPPADTRASVNLPPGLESWLHRDLIPVVIGSAAVQREPDLARRTDQMNGDVLLLPIVEADKAIGGLTVWHRHPNHYLPWHETLLEMVAELLLMILNCWPTACREGGRRGFLKDEATKDTDQGGLSLPIKPYEHRTVDPLTGLPDRLTFELRLQELAAIPISGFHSCFVLYLVYPVTQTATY